jgi:hypothetical protein
MRWAGDVDTGAAGRGLEVVVAGVAARSLGLLLVRLLETTPLRRRVP